MISAGFDLQVTRYLLSSFESMGLFVQDKFKIDFQDGNWGSYVVFPIGRLLAIFDLQVTQMLSAKFLVNWPFSSEEDFQGSSHVGYLGFQIGMI